MKNSASSPPPKTEESALLLVASRDAISFLHAMAPSTLEIILTNVWEKKKKEEMKKP